MSTTELGDEAKILLRHIAIDHGAGFSTAHGRVIMQEADFWRFLGALLLGNQARMVTDGAGRRHRMYDDDIHYGVLHHLRELATRGDPT